MFDFAASVASNKTIKRYFPGKNGQMQSRDMRGRFGKSELAYGPQVDPGSLSAAEIPIPLGSIQLGRLYLSASTFKERSLGELGWGWGLSLKATLPECAIYDQLQQDIKTNSFQDICTRYQIEHEATIGERAEDWLGAQGTADKFFKETFQAANKMLSFTGIIIKKVALEGPAANGTLSVSSSPGGTTGIHCTFQLAAVRFELTAGDIEMTLRLRPVGIGYGIEKTSTADGKLGVETASTIAYGMLELSMGPAAQLQQPTASMSVPMIVHSPEEKTDSIAQEETKFFSTPDQSPLSFSESIGFQVPIFSGFESRPLLRGRVGIAYNSGRWSGAVAISNPYLAAVFMAMVGADNSGRWSLSGAVATSNPYLAAVFMAIVGANILYKKWLRSENRTPLQALRQFSLAHVADSHAADSVIAINTNESLKSEFRLEQSTLMCNSGSYLQCYLYHAIANALLGRTSVEHASVESRFVREWANDCYTETLKEFSREYCRITEQFYHHLSEFDKKVETLEERQQEFLSKMDKDVSDLMRLNPDDPNSYLIRAQLYFRQEKDDQAVKNLKEAKTRAKNHSDQAQEERKSYCREKEHGEQLHYEDNEFLFLANQQKQLKDVFNEVVMSTINILLPVIYRKAEQRKYDEALALCELVSEDAITIAMKMKVRVQYKKAEEPSIDDSARKELYLAAFRDHTSITDITDDIFEAAMRARLLFRLLESPLCDANERARYVMEANQLYHAIGIDENLEHRERLTRLLLLCAEAQQSPEKQKALFSEAFAVHKEISISNLDTTEKGITRIQLLFLSGQYREALERAKHITDLNKRENMLWSIGEMLFDIQARHAMYHDALKEHEKTELNSDAASVSVSLRALLCVACGHTAATNDVKEQYYKKGLKEHEKINLASITEEIPMRARLHFYLAQTEQDQTQKQAELKKADRLFRGYLTWVEQGKPVYSRDQVIALLSHYYPELYVMPSFSLNSNCLTEDDYTSIANQLNQYFFAKKTIYLPIAIGENQYAGLFVRQTEATNGTWTWIDLFGKTNSLQKELILKIMNQSKIFIHSQTEIRQFNSDYLEDGHHAAPLLIEVLRYYKEHNYEFPTSSSDWCSINIEACMQEHQKDLKQVAEKQAEANMRNTFYRIGVYSIVMTSSGWLGLCRGTIGALECLGIQPIAKKTIILEMLKEYKFIRYGLISGVIMIGAGYMLPKSTMIAANNKLFGFWASPNTSTASASKMPGLRT